MRQDMIFIIGCGRSGTHLVANILNSHPGIRCTIEQPELFKLAREIAIQFDEEKLQTLLWLYEQQRRYTRQTYYADKSPTALWFAERLAEVFPKAKFLLVKRGIYGVVASMLEHRGSMRLVEAAPAQPCPFFGLTADNAAEYAELSLAAKFALLWQAHEHRGNSLMLGRRMHVVHYERLVSLPAEEIKQIQRFLGLGTPFAGVSIRKSSLNKWRGRLTPDNLRDIDAVHSHTRWTALEQSWEKRAAAMASLVTAGAFVVDFGCGSKCLQTYLPAGCRYLGVDRVDRGGTLVCDLNKERPMLPADCDIAFCGGVLEYLHDVPGFLRWLRTNFKKAVLSYYPTDLLQGDRSQWTNHYSQKEFEQIAQEAGWAIEQKRCLLKNQVAYLLGEQ